MSDEIGEFLRAVDGLDDDVHNALGVPMTDQIRLDRSVVEARLDAMDRGLASLRLTGKVQEHVDALRHLVATAKTMPFSKQLRLDKESIYDRLDDLRATLPEAIMEQRAAAEAARVHEVQLTADVRLTDLLRRVEVDDEILRIVRAGTVVAELRRPRP